MDNIELKELLEATHILNKYRNFWHTSNEDKEIRLSRMIDDFLPRFYNGLVEDKMARLVLEKINSDGGEIKVG